MVKVSVCCTVYNHSKYLKSALEGFVNQITDFEYEVIVHDDASTDDSARIIRYYENRYPNIIKGIYQENNLYSRGIGIFENIIRPRLLGEYIAFCEGDDYWSDCNKLQKQVDFLDSHKDYIACVHNTLKNDLLKNKSEIMYNGSKSRELFLRDVIKSGSCCYQTSSLMYRRTFFDNPIYELNKIPSHFSDYQNSIFLALCGRIYYFKDVMSVYRFGTKGSFSLRVGSNINAQLVVYKDMLHILEVINDYTKYEYNECFEEAILSVKYLILQDEGKYKELKKEPYYSIYSRKPFFYKIAVNILSMLGPLGNILVKIRRKIKYR